MKLAIFDIDGTLLKTELVSIPAYRKAMSGLNLPVPDDETIIRTFGCNDAQLVDILNIPPILAPSFLRTVEALEIQFMQTYAACYDGILQLLQWLIQSDCQIAVCSMCSPSYMDAFLKKFELNCIMTVSKNAAHGNDKTLLLRQLLEETKPCSAVMIGDRFFDIQAAKDNGLPSIGCVYGYAPNEVNLADIIVHDVGQLFFAIQKALHDFKCTI